MPISFYQKREEQGLHEVVCRRQMMWLHHNIHKKAAATYGVVAAVLCRGFKALQS